MQKKPFSSKSGIFKAPEGELKAPEALSEKVFSVSSRVYSGGRFNADGDRSIVTN
ncbi:hypothetical protein D3C87_682650 [compost metagenome]